MTKLGQYSPLTTSRGKVLDYLGMKIDYCSKGKVKFCMKKISKLLDEVPHDMEGVTKTPAANHLFNVNNNTKS